MRLDEDSARAFQIADWDEIRLPQQNLTMPTRRHGWVGRDGAGHARLAELVCHIQIFLRHINLTAIIDFTYYILTKIKTTEQKLSNTTVIVYKMVCIVCASSAERCLVARASAI